MWFLVSHNVLVDIVLVIGLLMVSKYFIVSNDRGSVLYFKWCLNVRTFVSVLVLEF
jgi:hypothetical protein